MMKFFRFRTTEKFSETREQEMVYDASGERIAKVREKVEREASKSRGLEWGSERGERQIGFSRGVFRLLGRLASLIVSGLFYLLANMP